MALGAGCGHPHNVPMTDRDAFAAARRALACAALVLAPVAAAASPELAPHSAGYVLELEEARPGAGVADVEGAMYFELEEACEGWSVRQEFRMVVTTEQGDSIPSQTVYTSYESKDGREFHFESITSNAGEVTEEIKGVAHLAGDKEGGTVDLTKPEPGEVALVPGTVFPTRHIEMLIEQAEDGAKFFGRPMFDGGDAAGAHQVSAAIGQRATLPAAEADSPLLQGPYWPVTMAFFGPDQTGEEPEFEVSGQVHANGIATEMSIDYGEFVVRGALTEITALDKPSC